MSYRWILVGSYSTLLQFFICWSNFKMVIDITYGIGTLGQLANGKGLGVLKLMLRNDWFVLFHSWGQFEGYAKGRINVIFVRTYSPTWSNSNQIKLKNSRMPKSRAHKTFWELFWNSVCIKFEGNWSTGEYALERSINYIKIMEDLVSWSIWFSFVLYLWCKKCNLFVEDLVDTHCDIILTVFEAVLGL